MNVRCPFDYHPTKPKRFICLDCGVERRQLDDEPGPEVVNRYCGQATTRLGDVVHKLANVIGFREQCEGCQNRHRILNDLDRKARQKTQQGWEALGKLGSKNINTP